MNTERLVRLLKLAIVLRAGRSCTVAELSIRMGVSRRTTLRDLAILRRVGILAEFDRETRSYRLEQGELIDSLSFSGEEAVAVMLVAENMHDIAFLPNSAAAASAGLKLERVLSSRQRDRISSELKTLRICSPPETRVRSPEQTLATLREAAMNRRKVEIEYDADNGDSSKHLLIHPYFLIFEADQWILVGFEPSCQQVGGYRVSRIAKANLFEDSFFEAPVGMNGARRLTNEPGSLARRGSRQGQLLQ